VENKGGGARALDLVTLSVCLFSIAAFSFEAVKQYSGLSVWKKED